MPETDPCQIPDVTCTACACLCDDLTVTRCHGRIVDVETKCPLARDWFVGQGEVSVPVACVAGRTVPFEKAIGRAAEILSRADAPLVYGLSYSATPGQRAAVSLADVLGATIDTTASLGHASSVMAVQQAGEQTCSLGEVRNRADVVVYWGADPVRTHPRHGERYAVDPVGEFITSRRDRHVVVVDIKKTRSTEAADETILVTPEQDFELMLALRMCLRGWSAALPEVVAGVPRAVVERLAERLKSARFGVAFFGYGLSRKGISHHNVEGLLRLVRDLNDYTRFYARRMRVVGDVTGADLVLAWQTGYPFAVSLSRGYPRYNPGEFSAWSVLERGEADACLLVGSKGIDRFSPRARAGLERIPVVAIDHPHQATREGFVPAVQFTTGAYGLHAAGTAYRMDEVPVPLKQILPRSYPTDAEVMEALSAAIRARR